MQLGAALGVLLLVISAAALTAASLLVGREVRRTAASVQRLHALRLALDALTSQARATGVAVTRTGDSVGEVTPR